MIHVRAVVAGNISAAVSLGRGPALVCGAEESGGKPHAGIAGLALLKYHTRREVLYCLIGDEFGPSEQSSEVTTGSPVYLRFHGICTSHCVAFHGTNLS